MHILVAVALPTDFEFQHSWDEDDQAAGTLAFDDASGSDNLETAASQLADVLELHHKKNGHPCLPDPALLDLLCGAETANTSGSKKKATKASKDPGNESLSASLIQWIGDGNQVEADVWPTCKPDMARLLYNDLSTWWSDLKKIVVAITPSVYTLIPQTDLSTQEHMNWVKAAAADLLDKSKYLHDGKDELGKTKKFAHPGLCEATILFLYVGMLKLLKDIMNDPYHGPKLVQWLHEWAEAGWAKFCKLDGINTSKHVHLQIELN
ncbi:hypothetical protein BDR06DRAFT_966819 [Suillus hirtellus]|nr:hypothetical protein BDR06DRAFT_966819 [Suillus hirtellus]